MDINLSGAVNQVSYGQLTFQLIKELYRLGHKIALNPIPDRNNIQIDPVYQSDIPIIREVIDNLHFYNRKGIGLRIWHEFDMTSHILSSANLAFPIFEIDSFDDLRKHQLNNVDGVIVCSQWAKRVVEKETRHKDVKVVPLGVDYELFTPARKTYDKFVFINVGKWEKRKGHDILGKMFLDLFRDKLNVELWMCTSNVHFSKEETAAWEREYQAPNIKLVPRLNSQMDLIRIMQQADVGIFPHRAEGHCLPASELHACGIPTIITNYSGPTEFCNKDNSYLVDATQKEPAIDGKWFNGTGNWARLGPNEIQRFKDCMWEAYNKPRAFSFKNEVAKSWSWENSAKELIRALETY